MRRLIKTVFNLSDEDVRKDDRDWNKWADAWPRNPHELATLKVRDSLKARALAILFSPYPTWTPFTFRWLNPRAASSTLSSWTGWEDRPRLRDLEPPLMQIAEELLWWFDEATCRADMNYYLRIEILQSLRSSERTKRWIPHYPMNFGGPPYTLAELWASRLVYPNVKAEADKIRRDSMQLRGLTRTNMGMYLEEVRVSVNGHPDPELLANQIQFILDYPDLPPDNLIGSVSRILKLLVPTHADVCLRLVQVLSIQESTVEQLAEMRDVLIALFGGKDTKLAERLAAALARKAERESTQRRASQEHSIVNDERRTIERQLLKDMQ